MSKEKAHFAEMSFIILPKARTRQLRETFTKGQRQSHSSRDGKRYAQLYKNFSKVLYEKIERKVICS